MKPLVVLIIVLFTLMVTVQVVGWVSQIYTFVHRYFGLRAHASLLEVYGRALPHEASSIGSPTALCAPTPPWVVITGGSSGQGREFALQFARHGFGIVIIGSARSHITAKLVRARRVPCIVIVKDFGRAFEDDFFDDIGATLAPLDCAILINNVGHRTGWRAFHEMPSRCLSETIACGTVVQTRLTHLLLPKLLLRLAQPGTRAAIVCITAQCVHPNTGFAIPGIVDNTISVPYLATYEAANAYGYFHACSLIQEYKDVERLDFLNITPGAVLTENTIHVLREAPFSVSAETFVQNILRFLGGNVPSGTTCAYWGHALSNALVGFAPWKKSAYMQQVGEVIADDYMLRYDDKVDRYAHASEDKMECMKKAVEKAVYKAVEEGTHEQER